MTPDPLGRGWTPSLGDRRRAGLSLLLGAALVLTPLWLGPVGTALAPSDTYRYEALAVNSAGDSLSVDGTSRGLYTHGITGVDCYADEPSRLCALEYELREGPTTVAEDPGGSVVRRYVHLDRFYERETERLPDRDRWRLSLEPVSAEAVLANVSTPQSDLSAQARRVVETGAVTTERRLQAAGRIVAADDGYVLVSLTAVDRPSGVPLPPASLVLPLSILAGFLLLRDGQRHYDRWRADRRT